MPPTRPLATSDSLSAPLISSSSGTYSERLWHTLAMTSAESLRIGVARRVITPPLPVALAGYGDRVQPATGVHDDLEARVVVFRSGDLTLCLVVLDLMAMSADWANHTRRAVAEALDVGVAHVMTSTTHTHAGPSTVSGTELLGWEVPKHWRPDLAEHCVSAALEAYRTAAPVELSFVRAPLEASLSFNRRGHSYAPTFAAFQATGESGEVLLTLLSIGVHGVVLGPSNREISGDWIGVCRTEVEKASGGTCVFVQGCHGDVDPHGMSWEGLPGDWFGAVDRVGNGFAACAISALGAAEPAIGPTRVVRHSTFDLDVAGSGMAMITRRDTVSVELAEWEVGGVRLVMVPGEGFAELGSQIVAGRADLPTLIVGFSPHWLGYLPVPFGEGYEEGLSFGADFVDRIATELASPR